MKNNYECEGIGVDAKCGKNATMTINSTKWNADTERMERIKIYLCESHHAELERFARKVLENK